MKVNKNLWKIFLFSAFLLSAISIVFDVRVHGTFDLDMLVILVLLFLAFTFEPVDRKDAKKGVSE